MIFIFCGSYLSVVDIIKAINKEQSSFMILSEDASIIKFFSEIYSPKNVFLLPGSMPDFSGPIKFIRSAINIHNNKAEVFVKLAEYNPCKVIFFFIGFNGMASWLIKKFSRTSNVYYKPGFNREHLRRGYKVKLQLMCLICSCLYGIWFAQKKNDWRNFIGASDAFLKSIKAKSYPLAVDMAHIEDVLNRKLSNLPELKVLVLICSKVNVENAYYCDEISSILKKLTHFIKPSEIGLKAHPKNDHNPNIKIPEGCIVYPKYLPANLLLLKCNAIISYESAALSEATDLGKKSISLLNMLKPIDEKRAIARKNYLAMRTNGNVRFPKTMNALLREVGVNNGKGVESL